MPLFSIDGASLDLILPKQFDREKEIQNLVEKNLEAVFSCKFVATEFSTGSMHGGRIDTLALTEDGNPAIIEYKKVESSELVNQSLFYLSWLNDHRGDFQVAAENVLGSDIQIDWSDIRVICIAPGYRKYDLHAVQMMGANIELWRYRLFGNNSLLFEEVYRRPGSSTSTDDKKKGTGDKAPDEPPMYTWEYHQAHGSKTTCELAKAIREHCLSLSDAVEESPKKMYVAYKVAKNFCCLEFQKKRALLYLRLNPAELDAIPEIGQRGAQLVTMEQATSSSLCVVKPSGTDTNNRRAQGQLRIGRTNLRGGHLLTYKPSH